MMTNDDYRHFVCIVAGENPKELMKPYDKSLKVPPYIIYKYEDAEKIHNTYIKMYESMLDNKDAVEEYGREELEDSLEFIKSLTTDEFFTQLTLKYDTDDDGNAITDENKDGKWSHYQLGKAFSIPFLTNDGREVFEALKGDIDWGSIHMNGTRVYERVWEMVMENSKPENDDEEVVYNNMKNKVNYFKKFENKETYVTSNTAFWGYAFLSEKTGWCELESGENQFAWMSNYYDVFIKNLPEDTKLTIYECVK